MTRTESYLGDTSREIVHAQLMKTLFTFVAPTNKERPEKAIALMSSKVHGTIAKLHLQKIDKQNIKDIATDLHQRLQPCKLPDLISIDFIQKYLEKTTQLVQEHDEPHSSPPYISNLCVETHI